MDNLDPSFFGIGCKKLPIELHGNDILVSDFINYNEHVQFFGQMDENLLFAIVIHAHIDFLFVVSLDEICHHRKSLFLRHKFKTRVTKSIIQPHLIDLPTTSFESVA